MKKFLVLNTKGGVGKSTITQHVLCPFLFEKTRKKVLLCEIDELNFDCVNLRNTEVFESKCFRLSEMSPVSMEEVFFSKKSVVIDVGGNISASESLRFFKKAHVLDLINFVIIPVLSGLQDALNAKQIMEELKEIANAKVILALNRAKDENLQYQFPHVFSYDDILSVFESVPEHIVVPDDNVIEFAKSYGITVWEIAQRDIQELLQKRKEALKEGNREKALRLTQRVYLVERAREFQKKLEEWVYVKLEKLEG